MPEKKEELIKVDTSKVPDSNYWRSFKQLYNDKDAVEESRHEFKEGVTGDFNPGQLSVLSRRKFLALVGASAALAGAGCSDYRDKGDIIPYTKKPADVTVGKANYYASTSRDGAGILVKTREGRPVKIDGNPDHPVSKGKVSAQAQADILNLYDPDRIHHPLKGGSEASWKKADEEIINALKNAGGKEIALITEKIISPTAKKVLDDFKSSFPSVKIYSYSLFNEDVRNAAWRKTGGGSFPLIKWNEAKIILALEADFLGSGPSKIENARLFAEGRDIENLDKFSRLYVVEGNMSLTGMNADYRLRLRPDAQYEFVRALRAGGGSLEAFAKKYNLDPKVLNNLNNDLRRNAGKAIVYAGSALPGYVHEAVNSLNESIGASALYDTASSGVDLMENTPVKEWKNLISSMNGGRVAMVIHFDSNPAYHLPKNLAYESAVKKVPVIVSLTETVNESSQLAHYTLPVNHPLESWGDAKTRTGFLSLQQPVISPIFNTRQKEAVLLTWIEGKADFYSDRIYHDYLKNNWQSSGYVSAGLAADFDQSWNLALHDGVVKSNVEDTAPDVSMPEYFQQPEEPKGFAVVLKESFALCDGRYASNGWLQELPHPVSKITWDNYAAISHTTAKQLNVENDDLIEVDVKGRKVTIPVFIQPGSADNTVTIELGYGRKNAGVVGSDVGFDASVLMSTDDGLSSWLYTGASVKKAGGTYKVVTAQEHHVFDDELTKDAAAKRKIIQEGTVDQYRENPNFLHQRPGHSQDSFYPEFEYNGVKWGMAIDMNKCIGCSDCVVACTSENNIPVVGKDQVAMGREMHWLRIDRYYSGSPDEPKVSNQVMLCQHCDHAPCENVCPVVATTHSPDGLNQMIYNRCVGTRYCSNNCPYKVRRFNFYNFRDHFRDAHQENSLFNLVYNPEVTVRSRGVMEKCTFCIQRIMEAREDAVKLGREIKGTDVKTACQEACATGAIKFGDMNDKNSEFYKYRAHNLGYYVLEELNVRPNVTYIAKLRNIHSEDK